MSRPRTGGRAASLNVDVREMARLVQRVVRMNGDPGYRPTWSTLADALGKSYEAVLWWRDHAGGGVTIDQLKAAPDVVCSEYGCDEIPPVGDDLCPKHRRPPGTLFQPWPPRG